MKGWGIKTDRTRKEVSSVVEKVDAGTLSELVDAVEKLANVHLKLASELQGLNQSPGIARDIELLANAHSRIANGLEELNKTLSTYREL